MGKPIGAGQPRSFEPGDSTDLQRAMSTNNPLTYSRLQGGATKVLRLHATLLENVSGSTSLDDEATIRRPLMGSSNFSVNSVNWMGSTRSLDRVVESRGKEEEKSYEHEIGESRRPDPIYRVMRPLDSGVVLSYKRGWRQA